MKIARVEPFHVDWGAGRGRSAWVRIWTDDGSFGLGEASPGRGTDRQLAAGSPSCSGRYVPIRKLRLVR